MQQPDAVQSSMRRVVLFAISPLSPRVSWRRRCNGTLKASFVHVVPWERHVIQCESDAGKVQLKSLSLRELEDEVRMRFGGKKHHARRMWAYMYRDLVPSFEHMTDLTDALVQRLKQQAVLEPLVEDMRSESGDGTRKVVLRGEGGAVVESVVIPSRKRSTVCVSSQVGCAMGCRFCFTAKMGLRQHLPASHIVQQVVLARRLSAHAPLNNVVFMGMGEPLDNYGNMMKAIDILTSPVGLALSHNKVSVSTSGLVPQMLRFASETRAKLAVSLNATSDEQRSALMPVNNLYPLTHLVAALHHYTQLRKEPIFIEYVMLAGINDSADDAARLVKLLSGLRCKINLIPFNSHPGTHFVAPRLDTILWWRDFLLTNGIHATMRATRGDKELAACGQLSTKALLSAPVPAPSTPLIMS